MRTSANVFEFSPRNGFDYLLFQTHHSPFLIIEINSNPTQADYSLNQPSIKGHLDGLYRARPYERPGGLKMIGLYF